MSGQPTDTETYYDLLGVRDDAAPERIKKAYRCLVKEYHPDRIPEHLGRLRKDAAEKFGLITEAYQILRDRSRRAAYDRQLEKLRRASRPRSASPRGPSGSGARARSGNRSGPSRRRTRTASSTGSPASPSARQRVRRPSLLVAFLQSGKVLEFVGMVLFAAVSVAGSQGAMHVLDSVQPFSLAFWLASALLIACIPGVLLAAAILFELALLLGVLWVVVWVVQYLFTNLF